jgi:hypothetical protein
MSAGLGLSRVDRDLPGERVVLAPESDRVTLRGCRRQRAVSAPSAPQDAPSPQPKKGATATRGNHAKALTGSDAPVVASDRRQRRRHLCSLVPFPEQGSLPSDRRAMA